MKTTKRTLEWLRENLFDTEAAEEGCTHHMCEEGDQEEVHIILVVNDPDKLVRESVRLRSLLESRGIEVLPLNPNTLTVGIQACFDPGDGQAVIDLMEVHDDMLFPELN